MNIFNNIINSYSNFIDEIKDLENPELEAFANQSAICIFVAHLTKIGSKSKSKKTLHKYIMTEVKKSLENADKIREKFDSFIEVHYSALSHLDSKDMKVVEKALDTLSFEMTKEESKNVDKRVAHENAVGNAFLLSIGRCLSLVMSGTRPLMTEYFKCELNKILPKYPFLLMFSQPSLDKELLSKTDSFFNKINKIIENILNNNEERHSQMSSCFVACFFQLYVKQVTKGMSKKQGERKNMREDLCHFLAHEIAFSYSLFDDIRPSKNTKCTVNINPVYNKLYMNYAYNREKMLRDA